MLITTCAHCNARFRVTPQQLNLRQGQVRCGRCSQVFNGFAALERFPDDDTGTRLLQAHEQAERTRSGVPPPPPPRADDEMPEIETLDANSVPAPHIQDSPAVLPEAEPSLQEDAPVFPGPPPPPPAPFPPLRRTLGDAHVVLAPPESPKPLSRAWAFGVVLLAFLLVLEAVYAYRGPLAQRYPVLRPTLESACAQLQCTVPWSREETLLKLEDSELLEVPGKPNEIALGARVRNLSSAAQEYPHIELTLTDSSGQAAVRRVLRPTDYLGRPVGQGEVMPPGVEVALQMRLETPRLKATGYELLLFYP